jgi:hypothetical protein
MNRKVPYWLNLNLLLERPETSREQINQTLPLLTERERKPYILITLTTTILSKYHFIFNLGINRRGNNSDNLIKNRQEFLTLRLPAAN